MQTLSQLSYGPIVVSMSLFTPEHHILSLFNFATMRFFSHDPRNGEAVAKEVRRRVFPLANATGVCHDAIMFTAWRFVVSIVADRAYRTELLSLLRASTLTPGTYRPVTAVIYNNHAVVLVGGTPVILCGDAGDPASRRQAETLVRSRRFAAGVRVAGHTGEITTGTVSGADVPWTDPMTAIVKKEPGDTGRGIGPVVAIVIDDPHKKLATYLCVTTETARALDPSAPALDDGFLGELARNSLPTFH